MRFNKDHIRFIRNQYVINKAFCHIAVALISIAILFFSFYAANEFLSVPPGEGKESRHFTECSGVYADDNLCSRASSESEKNASTDETEAEHRKYVPKEFIKNKRDLNAQEGMWRATNLLGYLTVIQALIGLITVGIVGYTLMQTREILREAKETTRQAGAATVAADRTAQAAENASRAHLYLVLDPTVKVHDEVKVTTTGELYVCFNSSFTLQNYGGTPAEAVSVKITPNPVARSENNGFEIFENWNRPFKKSWAVVNTGPSSVVINYIHHDRINIGKIHRRNDKKPFAEFVVEWSYESIFSGDVYKFKAKYRVFLDIWSDSSSLDDSGPAYMIKEAYAKTDVKFRHPEK